VKILVFSVGSKKFPASLVQSHFIGSKPFLTGSMNTQYEN
jgi:hypothetical protein